MTKKELADEMWEKLGLDMGADIKTFGNDEGDFGHLGEKLKEEMILALAGIDVKNLGFYDNKDDEEEKEEC